MSLSPLAAVKTKSNLCRYQFSARQQAESLVQPLSALQQHGLVTTADESLLGSGASNGKQDKLLEACSSSVLQSFFSGMDYPFHNACAMHSSQEAMAKVQHSCDEL